MSEKKEKILIFFGREERFALMILIIVLLAILTSHIFLSDVEKSSFAAEYKNSSEEDSLVSYSGIISTISSTKTGGHLVIETDGPVIFFAEGTYYKDWMHEGDRIKVTGMVSVYNGKKEIIVDDIRDIKIL